MPVVRESSSESAARFLAARERKRERRERALTQQLSRGPLAPSAQRPRATARRIVLDLAEPTLRLIHDVLLDAIAMGALGGDRLNLTLIAEQMVAVALGEPPCDDPPLTDRGKR